MVIVKFVKTLWGLLAASPEISQLLFNIFMEIKKIAREQDTKKVFKEVNRAFKEDDVSILNDLTSGRLRRHEDK